MTIARNIFIGGALLAAIALAPLASLAKSGDAISTAEQADVKAGISAPGIVETKAIAEEAFI